MHLTVTTPMTALRPRTVTSRVVFAAVLVTLAATITVMVGGEAQAGAQADGPCTPEWALSFEDDFDGQAVDTSSWRMYDSPGHAGNGLRRPDAMSVADGVLTITAQDEDGQVVSGGMDSRASWTYGRFEARARTAADASETMSGVVIAWPEQQDFVNGNYRELNLYETGHLGPRRPLGFFVHYAIPNNPSRPRFTADVDASQWHDVRMDWTSDRVAFWVDGSFVGETTRPETIPRRDMSMTLQLDAFRQAIGSDESVTMDVDWVRVWSWNPAGSDECAGDVPGADGPVQVAHTTTCLAGNGRIDTNIVNIGSAPAAYRIEFQGLSPRQKVVNGGDWWRMPVTGRFDGTYEVVVRRDGVPVSRQNVLVACDSEAALVSNDEIQVVNACRVGFGYLLFQFANSTMDPRGWVIEFDGVPNRSTSALAAAGAVRAVTGRQDGDYDVRIRSGDSTIAIFEVTVDCSSVSSRQTLDVSVDFEDGSPAAGVTVDLFESDGTDRIEGGFVESVVTDSQGNYSWELEDRCWAVVVERLDGTSFEPGNPDARFDEQHVCTNGSDVSFQSVLYRAENVHRYAGRIDFAGQGAAANVQVDLFLSLGNGQRGDFLRSQSTGVGGDFSFTVLEGCYAITAVAPTGWTFTEGATDEYEELHRCTEGSDIVLSEPLTLYPAPVVG